MYAAELLRRAAVFGTPLQQTGYILIRPQCTDHMLGSTGFQMRQQPLFMKVSPQVQSLYLVFFFFVISYKAPTP